MGDIYKYGTYVFFLDNICYLWGGRGSGIWGSCPICHWVHGIYIYNYICLLPAYVLFGEAGIICSFMDPFLFRMFFLVNYIYLLFTKGFFVFLDLFWEFGAANMGDNRRRYGISSGTTTHRGRCVKNCWQIFFHKSVLRGCIRVCWSVFLFPAYGKLGFQVLRYIGTQTQHVCNILYMGMDWNLRSLEKPLDRLRSTPWYSSQFPRFPSIIRLFSPKHWFPYCHVWSTLYFFMSEVVEPVELGCFLQCVYFLRILYLTKGIVVSIRTIIYSDFPLPGANPKES